MHMCTSSVHAAVWIDLGVSSTNVDPKNNQKYTYTDSCTNLGVDYPSKTKPKMVITILVLPNKSYYNWICNPTAGDWTVLG